MTPGPAAPGIRRRRHEAARRTLEAHGWQQYGRTADGRRYRHIEHPGQWLLVGVGGALYWTTELLGPAASSARRRDGAGPRAALDAARETR